MTLALHVAPGEVRADSVALAPGLTDAGRLVMLTESEATGGAVRIGVVGAEVTRAVGATVAAGFVGETPSGMT